MQSVTSRTDPTVSKQIPSLANHLHDLAARFALANDSLSEALERLAGAMPATAGGKIEPQPPEPQGALPVAQFGAERIRQQLEVLEGRLARLNDLV
jgi:hypothetical protein